MLVKVITFISKILINRKQATRHALLHPVPGINMSPKAPYWFHDLLFPSALLFNDCDLLLVLKALRYLFFRCSPIHILP